jgi:hypothetical protein
VSGVVIFRFFKSENGERGVGRGVGGGNGKRELRGWRHGWRRFVGKDGMKFQWRLVEVYKTFGYVEHHKELGIMGKIYEIVRADWVGGLCSV